MTSTRITPNSDVIGTSIDLSALDVDQALQRGRHLRAQAFSAAFKALFRGSETDRDQRNDRGRFSPDCAAAA
ncbi:MAG: hypothetical protein ACR2QH_15405 [Geminicoccaceae bacterium]